MKTLLMRPFIDTVSGISPPVSIMYLSSFLKSKNLDVKLIDNCTDRYSIGKLCSDNPHVRGLLYKIDEYGPDVIGMTLFSRELTDIAILCKLIKKRFKRCHIVLGGPHPTVMPQKTLEEIVECDFVVRGEGEVVLYNLLSSLSKGGDLHSVKGISFRDATTGRVFHCDDADVIGDLDSLPFPDRESLVENYRDKYGSFVYGIPSDVIMTSRGCPFQCNFCFKVCKRYRSRSPENVMGEVDWVVNNIRPQNIQFMDDSFTIEKKRCLKILEYLAERKYPCEFKARSRVDVVDEELLRKMKRAGIGTVVYGFESGSQTMLDSFNKRTRVEQNIRACRLTKKAGIDCFGDILLFYPGENRETLRETEAFIRAASPTAVQLFVLTPLPETRVYDEAREKGSLISDWGVNKETPWIKLDGFKNLNEMEHIAKRMFIKSVLRPATIFWAMKTIKKHFFKDFRLCIRMIAYSFLKRNKY